MLVAGGSTNVTTYFAMRLAADGTAATGLTATNFDLQYVRSGSAPSAKVDATAGTAGGAAAHSDNTVVEPDATDQPGLYRVDWPDAAFAAGVREVILTVKVATAFTEHLRCEIDGEVNVVEWAGTDVVAGAIPAFAADAAGGLPISDAGGLDLDTILDAAITTRLAPTTAGRTLDITATGEAGLDLDNTSGTLDAAQIGADAITEAKIADNAIATEHIATAAITADSLGADAITAAKVAADVHAEAADAVWDEVLTGATHNVVNSAGRRLRQIQEAGGYSFGAIYIDTVNGAAGTTDFENGVDSNPVDSIADANTLAASLGISTFRIAAGSTITLAAAQNNQSFSGDNWTLALGGQDITGSVFAGATVSGIASGTGTRQIFHQCLMDACSHVAGTHILESGISGTQTVVEAGDYFLDRCHSGIAGTATWVWEFGDAIGNTNLNVRNYSGGIQLESMGDTGTDTVSIEGRGQIIEGTCTGGTVAVRGSFTVSGITNLTLSDDARIDVGQINAEVDAALSDYDGPTNAEMEVRTLPAAEIAQLTQNLDNCATGTASGTPTTTSMISDLTVTVDDQFNGRILTFDDDTTTAALRKQATDITGCTAASDTLTFTALTTAPVSGDKYTLS